MQPATTPVRVDDFCVRCQDDPCSGVRSIGEILGELLGTTDRGQRQNAYGVSGLFRLATASGRTESAGR